VGVVAHNLTILASTGLRLISIHDKIVGTTIRDLGHERPLKTRGETSTTTTTKAGGLNLVNNPVTTKMNEILGAVPITLDMEVYIRIRKRLYQVCVTKTEELRIRTRFRAPSR
jgi:hypothetical protein